MPDYTALTTPNPVETSGNVPENLPAFVPDTSLFTPLTAAHRQKLSGVMPPGFDPDAAGVLSTGGARPGILFPWNGETGPVYQLLPDVRRTDADGGEVKYEFGPGQVPQVTLIRPPADDAGVLVVEGTKQRYWAAHYAPAAYGVYAVAGCWNTRGDLGFAEDRDIVIMFDADVADNRQVHTAATRLREALETDGAASVSFARIPSRGGDRTGADDFLAAIPDGDRRYRTMSRLIAQARPTLGKPPPHRAGNRPGSQFFDKEGLKVMTLADDVLGSQPAALTAEREIALYRNGVFRTMGDLPLVAEVVERLGDLHRASHMTSVKQTIQSRLYARGVYLPERTQEPLANFTNGMVDLRTARVLPHDPGYLSRVQHPVAWDPGARCPVYEQWIKDVLPDQIDDIEEIAGSLLDRSRTPSKALFAYGPSHSGKSTFIRLLIAVAGQDHTSAVTLHQLSDNRFAAANVYGMALNAASDLSSAEVNDLSVFKMMTGEDPIQADRKYGQQFAFTNTALFAFSANELPVVSEASNAYRNRIKPFHFSRSFQGREDPGVEKALMGELPGIVRRWAAAYHRFLARGAHLPTEAGVAASFDQGSDRVRMWVSTQLRVVPVRPELGQAQLLAEPTVKVGSGTTGRELAAMFKMWAERNGGRPIGTYKLYERLISIDGVQRVRILPTRGRGFNLVAVPDSDSM